MEIRKMLNMVDAGGADGAGAAGGEVFEFAQVASKMKEILAVKNETVKLLDDLTHSLEEQVKNGSKSAAYGGDISAFWSKWNAFQATYNNFGRYIEGVDAKVSEASKKNQALQGDISNIMASGTEGNADAATSTYGTQA